MDEPDSNYYRPTAFPGAADQLESLAEGYFDLYWAFLGTVVGGAILFVLSGAISANTSRPDPTHLFTAAYAVLTGATALFSYRPTKSILSGLGWTRRLALPIALGVGLSSIFCCGFVGYGLVQQVAYDRLKRYGVKTSIFVMRWKDIEPVLTSIRKQEALQGKDELGED